MTPENSTTSGTRDALHPARLLHERGVIGSEGSRHTARLLHRGRLLHPAGWVALTVMATAFVFSSTTDTDHLIGNLQWWHWATLILIAALAGSHQTLHRVRLGIETASSATRPLAWVLVWVVFGLQIFNVATRYGNDFVEADILFGETASLAWQSFGLMCLVGINYGVRDGVNPRIDFWWSGFSDRTKAALDFTLHTMLLLPFTVMSVRILQSYAATSLGRRHNGEWPYSWYVWDSWEGSNDAGGLPVGPIKTMLLVGFALLGMQVVAEIIKAGFVLIGRNDYASTATPDTDTNTATPNPDTDTDTNTATPNPDTDTTTPNPNPDTATPDTDCGASGQIK